MNAACLSVAPELTLEAIHTLLRESAELRERSATILLCAAGVEAQSHALSARVKDTRKRIQAAWEMHTARQTFDNVDPSDLDS